MKIVNVTILFLMLSLSMLSLSCSTKSQESPAQNNDETDSHDVTETDAHNVICLDLQTGKVMEGWCFIDGECVEVEQRSEEGGCGVCDPSDAKYAWTPVPDGTECTTEQGNATGYCQSGNCVVTTCECDGESLCCDGCHPINIGDPCGDGAECASHTCTETGECHLSILDGWCLEGTGTESDPYTCFDARTDLDNCGSCGHKCLEEQSCISGQCVVLVTGVSVSPKTLILSPGGSGTLTAAIAPPAAHNQDITWKSADTSIATVNKSGQVQAHRVGETTITATAEEGNFSDTAIVKVHDTYGPCENEG
ncbi:MAG: Ig-like domain-containing protein, partial [Proteobacteria bacterium]|nr:Ig-like domain-containing protein [Pseudomonadota bacterium]